MKVPVYTMEGKEVGTTELPKEIFEVPMQKDLMHQVAVAQMANKRQVSAHTKTRSEVSGGGRKPWRQKGTGRARHGSIRSPIWVGGGITFGPRKNKNYKQKINKKMGRKALFMALSEKAKRGQLLVLDKIVFEKPKTKAFYAMLQLLPVKHKSSLIVMPGSEKGVMLSVRNIQKTKALPAKQLNLLEVLSKTFMVMPKDSIQAIQETFHGND
ncbi:MAG: 50S ribosomal protein L4 [bacterium]|nr:50S ribosomal protein L4 [bacterium]